MALTLIGSPDNAPSTTADWDKVNDVLQTIGLDINSPVRISGSNILRGSVIFFAGAWYVATSDTAISGSATDYVRLTNSAGTVSAAFVSSLTGVTFNQTWNGWYDSSLRLFIFDEVKAYADGAIGTLKTVKNYRPSQNWSKAISRVLSATNLSRFFHPDAAVTLSGSGTYTVPSGVYQIDVFMIGPGSDGQIGATNKGGAGGNSGEEKTFTLNVTPGQTISYSITSTSTIFGGTTALKGAGYLGQTGTTTSAGSGGGYKAGVAGEYSEDGGDAVDGYGGGGGGGGYSIGSPGSIQAGGAGALGRIDIK